MPQGLIPCGMFMIKPPPVGPRLGVAAPIKTAPYPHNLRPLRYFRYLRYFRSPSTQTSQPHLHKRLSPGTNPKNMPQDIIARGIFMISLSTGSYSSALALMARETDFTVVSVST